MTSVRADEPPGTGLTYPPALEDIVAALREQPVLVDPLFGNGDTVAVRDGLAELAAAVDEPVFVVLVPAPDVALDSGDPLTDLATRLSLDLGPGYYAVDIDPMHGSGRVVPIGIADPVRTYEARDEHGPDPSEERDPADYPSDVGSLARELDVIAHGGDIDGATYTSYAEDAPWAAPPEWESTSSRDAALPSTYVADGGLAFVIAAGVAWLLLRNAATWRTSRRPATSGAVSLAKRPGRSRDDSGRAEDVPPGIAASTSVADLRVVVESELTDLAEARAAVDLGRLPSVRRERLEASDEAARLVLATAGSRERDLDDVVGALVLVRRARFALDDDRHDAVYRPCFFDPRHGRGTRTRSVPLGETDVSVACCRWCARVPAARLSPLTVRRKPYFEHDTVWARTGFGTFVDDLEHQVLDELRGGR